MNYEEFLDSIKTPKKLLEFMGNIKYGFVDENEKIYEDNNNEWFEKCRVQLGCDIFKTKYGNCWDQVEIERDWFAKNGYNYKTIFIIFQIKKPNSYPTHTFLVYEKEDKWYWFEHSFEKYRGVHCFNSFEELLNDVKNKHLEYAISIKVAKVSDKKLLRCYEYTKPKAKLSVSDYIKHVISGKLIL